jgi:outer membrane receptor protein involved in Fe transport
MNKSKLAIALLGLFQAASGHARDDSRLDHYLAMSLDELLALEVTISSDSPRPVARAPAVVTLITADDIKATGATNLADLLEGVPGIHVRASSFGYRPLVHFRGANATQTLLMVDGAPMKDLMWGFGIFWKGLPASMIERVEIIRGPGSALFGADASAGVINVITKAAGTIRQSEAGLRAGSFDSQAAWFQHGADWNGYQVGLTAELSDSAGHDPYIGRDADGDSGRAGYGWRNRDLRLGVAKGHWRLDLDYLRHADLEVGLTGGNVLDPVTRANDSRYGIALAYDNPAWHGDWGLGAVLRYQHLDYSSGAGFQEHAPGYVDADDVVYPIGVVNRNQAAERRADFEVKGLYTGFTGHQVRVGAGYSRADLYSVRHVVNDPGDLSQLIDVSDTPDAFAPELARVQRFAYLQDIWFPAEDWELTAGLRYDHYSDFGASVNPRLALVWRSSERLTSKLMYGRAFRAPNYRELYSPTSVADPNPNLKPERSRTWDLAFSYAASKDLNLGAGLYHMALSDLIAAVAGQYQNTGSYAIRGVELEAQWQATRTVRLSGNYSQRDPDAGGDTFYLPRREAYLRADWAFRPGWNWNVQANWTGRQERAANDTRAPVAAQTVVDTTLRYLPGAHWEFAASARNLFDIDAREYTGRSLTDDLPLPGRNFYAEMRYKF